jgi:argininosuccinate synthase
MLFHEGQFLDPVMRNIEAFRRHSENSKREKLCSLKPYHLRLTELNQIMI